MKKKSFVVFLALIMVLAMIPQAVFADTATKFSGRPVIKTLTTGSVSVKVTWSKVAGADGYYIYRAKDGKTFKKIKDIKSGGILKYSDTGLSANTEYFYRIKAYKVRNGKKQFSPYSWAKEGNAGIPQTVRNFSAYTSDGEKIYLHWFHEKWAKGFLVYRSEKKDGTYKQIAKIKGNPGDWAEYADRTVTPGKTYYYKVRPYITYNGKIIKGKYTKASGEPAMRKNPKAEIEMSQGRNSRELIAKVTMKDFSYDTEFLIISEEGNNLGKIELNQKWKNGTALETRETMLILTGFSADGENWMASGSVSAEPGETVYLRAVADEAIELGNETEADLAIYCRYNGKYAVVHSNEGE